MEKIKSSERAKQLEESLDTAKRYGADEQFARSIGQAAFEAAYEDDREALSVFLSSGLPAVRKHIPQAARAALRAGHLETALWIIETAKLSADDFSAYGKDCRFCIALRKLADAVGLATAVCRPEESDELVCALRVAR